jgi:hypothetical protein
VLLRRKEEFERTYTRVVQVNERRNANQSINRLSVVENNFFKSFLQPCFDDDCIHKKESIVGEAYLLSSLLAFTLRVRKERKLANRERKGGKI